MSEFTREDLHPSLGGMGRQEGDALSHQEGGRHYADFVIQPVEFIERNDLGFCEGNVVKYVARHRAKGGAEDLLKARHYIDLLLQLRYGHK